eukprot:GHVU01201996.1.p1 GENE.GHVU01201996.1~~GHVU01201996.1.p1  ORF type:complete len:283 (+),score=57.92 GHVU01201996.1:57-851(+)
MSNKRTGEPLENTVAKKPRDQLPFGITEEEQGTFLEIQESLQELDRECQKKQVAIQQDFDRRKRPHFEKRNDLISRHRGLWGHLITEHPDMIRFITLMDQEIFKHLRSLDVEDSLDVSGSYRITLRFDDAVKEFFEPTKIIKHVKFPPMDADDGGDESDEPESETTVITFKKGKDPTEVASAERAKIVEAAEKTGELPQADLIRYSIFEWFLPEWDQIWQGDPFGGIDPGETIRREIWHSPLDALASSSESDDGDEDGDDEDGA